MSQSELEPLPIRIDPQHFADSSKTLHGLVAATAMKRLQENVTAIEPMVSVMLQFSRGLYGYPLVVGEVHAEVSLQCERCLDEMKLNLDSAVNVLIKPVSEHMPEDSEDQEDGPDLHEYDGKSLILSDLIEEELLLTLPLVPKHKDISLCNQDMIAWLASNEGQKEALAEKSDNPFAILKR